MLLSRSHPWGCCPETSQTLKGFCQEAIHEVAVQQLRTKASVKKLSTGLLSSSFLNKGFCQEAIHKVAAQQLETKASVKKPSTRLLSSSFKQRLLSRSCRRGCCPAASNEGFCQEATHEVAVQQFQTKASVKKPSARMCCPAASNKASVKKPLTRLLSSSFKQRLLSRSHCFMVLSSTNMWACFFKAAVQHSQCPLRSGVLMICVFTLYHLIRCIQEPSLLSSNSVLPATAVHQLAAAFPVRPWHCCPAMDFIRSQAGLLLPSSFSFFNF